MLASSGHQHGRFNLEGTGWFRPTSRQGLHGANAAPPDCVSGRRLAAGSSLFKPLANDPEFLYRRPWATPPHRGARYLKG